jgi:hypothetical protein
MGQVGMGLMANIVKRLMRNSSWKAKPQSYTEQSPKLALNSLYGKEFVGAQVANFAFFFGGW